MRHHRHRFALERLEPRDVPAAQFAAVGSDAGDVGRAQLVDTETGVPRYSVFPFGTDFTGGVRVAAGDVNGDGVTDLIAAPGAGGGPVVKVYDGVLGIELRSQLVFDASFRGGLYVAAGDTNLDGKAEVIAGAGEGGGPAVVVIDGASGAVSSSFLAFGDGFRGGVRVAAGDVDGDGRADVIAAAGPGGAPHVRAVSVALPCRELASFYAYDPSFAGGVFVASADLDADGIADIITGTGAGGGPLVNGFRANGTALTSFLAADAGSRTGVRVGVANRGYFPDVTTVVPGVGVGRFTPTGGALGTTGLSGGWVGGPAEATPDTALLWNQVALRAIAADDTPAPAAARALAMVQLGVFQAVNAIEKRYAPYFFGVGAADGADPEAAAVFAGERVLSGLFPEQAEEFVRVRNARLALIPDGTPKDAGLEAGALAAAFIRDFRRFDGSEDAATFLYTPGADPGDWRPTPPDEAPFLLPGWGFVRPFAIPSARSFAPDGPPDLTSEEYAAELEIVRVWGRDTAGSDRSPDATGQAFFWQGGASMNVVTQGVVRRQNLDPLDSARTFALVTMAGADAAIVAWDAKLTYDRWRPITAIREADTDGNPATTADPTWAPLLVTPNHPDHVSDLAAVAGAGAAVLTGLFGGNYLFRTYSPAVPGVPRDYVAFRQAAWQAAMSEVYGGIQLPSAGEAGEAAGEAVGTFVLDTQLQPTF